MRILERIERLFAGRGVTTEDAKARKIEARIAELADRLPDLEDELTREEAEGAIAEALGDSRAAEEGRARRSALRAEQADVKGAIAALQAAREELEPLLIAEEAKAVLQEHEEAFEAARRELLDRARPALRTAVEAWDKVEAHYGHSVAAVQRYGALRHRLAEEFGRNGLPVPPSSVDRQLLSGLRRWEAQATSRELPNLLARAREEEG